MQNTHNSLSFLRLQDPHDTEFKKQYITVPMNERVQPQKVVLIY